MTRWGPALVFAGIAAGVVSLTPAACQDKPPIVRDNYGAVIVGTSLYVLFDPNQDMTGMLAVLSDRGPVTGFAFGPGREEVAYCAPVDDQGQWGLWVIHVSYRRPAEYRQVSANPEPEDFSLEVAAKPRLLWTAPSGMTLRGPVWWSPDGSWIAVQAVQGDAIDVMAVEYGSGQHIWLCRGREVVDLVWGPLGERVAYVAKDGGDRRVWLQTRPPGQPRDLGGGGFDLRWSLDGESLSWLRAKSDGVWVEMTWDRATGEVTEADPQPARQEGSMWSPDGQLCATLEPSPESDEGQVVIYPRRAAAGERVALPHARADRLLGWSPDSSLILALGDLSLPVVIAARPMDDRVRQMMALGNPGYQQRWAIGGYPMDASAGPPSWSSGGDMLAYVVARSLDTRLGIAGDTGSLNGSLIAMPVISYRFPPTAPGEPDLREQAERAVVLSCMKNIALALYMYLQDNDDVFPLASSTEEFVSVMQVYVRAKDVFIRPGSEDEVMVQYLVPPGLPLVESYDPATMPVAVADYHPNFVVIAYGDGHAAVHEKEGEYWETWEAWWRKFWERREREGG